MSRRSVLRLFAVPTTRRHFSTTLRAQDGLTDPTKGNAARWLADTRTRIGKCIMFGMPTPLIDEAGEVAAELGNSWRQIVAGSEGYLTDPQRAGLHRHSLVWGDQDSMGHVNNVRYVRWAESGRCNWTSNFAKLDPANKQLWTEILTPRNVGLILKSIKVDYKFPMNWPDKVDVYHKLQSEPNEKTGSMLLDVMILSEAKQRPSARCLEDIVVYDYKAAAKTSLPPFMLDQFKLTWRLQEEAKREGLTQIRRIEERVRRLETQSWDRPDAKEDFGIGPS